MCFSLCSTHLYLTMTTKEASLSRSPPREVGKSPPYKSVLDFVNQQPLEEDAKSDLSLLMEVVKKERRVTRVRALRLESGQLSYSIDKQTRTELDGQVGASPRLRERMREDSQIRDYLPRASGGESNAEKQPPAKGANEETRKQRRRDKRRRNREKKRNEKNDGVTVSNEQIRVASDDAPREHTGEDKPLVLERVITSITRRALPKVMLSQVRLAPQPIDYETVSVTPLAPTIDQPTPAEKYRSAVGNADPAPEGKPEISLESEPKVITILPDSKSPPSSLTSVVLRLPADLRPLASSIKSPSTSMPAKSDKMESSISTNTEIPMAHSDTSQTYSLPVKDSQTDKSSNLSTQMKSSKPVASPAGQVKAIVDIFNGESVKDAFVTPITDQEAMTPNNKEAYSKIDTSTEEKKFPGSKVFPSETQRTSSPALTISDALPISNTSHSPDSFGTSAQSSPYLSAKSTASEVATASTEQSLAPNESASQETANENKPLVVEEVITSTLKTTPSKVEEGQFVLPLQQVEGKSLPVAPSMVPTESSIPSTNIREQPSPAESYRSAVGSVDATPQSKSMASFQLESVVSAILPDVRSRKPLSLASEKSTQENKSLTKRRPNAASLVTVTAEIMHDQFLTPVLTAVKSPPSSPTSMVFCLPASLRGKFAPKSPTMPVSSVPIPVSGSIQYKVTGKSLDMCTPILLVQPVAQNALLENDFVTPKPLEEAMVVNEKVNEANDTPAKNSTGTEEKKKENIVKETPSKLDTFVNEKVYPVGNGEGTPSLSPELATPKAMPVATCNPHSPVSNGLGPSSQSSGYISAKSEADSPGVALKSQPTIRTNSSAAETETSNSIIFSAPSSVPKKTQSPVSASESQLVGAPQPTESSLAARLSGSMPQSSSEVTISTSGEMPAVSLVESNPNQVLVVSSDIKPAKPQVRDRPFETALSSNESFAPQNKSSKDLQRVRSARDLAQFSQEEINFLVNEIYKPVTEEMTGAEPKKTDELLPPTASDMVLVQSSAPNLGKAPQTVAAPFENVSHPKEDKPVEQKVSSTALNKAATLKVSSSTLLLPEPTGDAEVDELMRQIAHRGDRKVKLAGPCTENPHTHFYRQQEHFLQEVISTAFTNGIREQLGGSDLVAPPIKDESQLVECQQRLMEREKSYLKHVHGQAGEKHESSMQCRQCGKAPAAIISAASGPQTETDDGLLNGQWLLLMAYAVFITFLLLAKLI